MPNRSPGCTQLAGRIDQRRGLCPHARPRAAMRTALRDDARSRAVGDSQRCRAMVWDTAGDCLRAAFPAVGAVVFWPSESGCGVPRNMSRTEIVKFNQCCAHGYTGSRGREGDSACNQPQPQAPRTLAADRVLKHTTSGGSVWQRNWPLRHEPGKDGEYRQAVGRYFGPPALPESASVFPKTCLRPITSP